MNEFTIDVTRNPPSKEQINNELNRLKSAIALSDRRMLTALISFIIFVVIGCVTKISGITGQYSPLIYLGCTVAAVLLIVYFGRVSDKSDNLKDMSNQLEQTERSVCTEIEKWLCNETIKTYRDNLVRQDRPFVYGEVKAMSDFYDKSEIIDEEERAYKAVYLVGVSQ